MYSGLLSLDVSARATMNQTIYPILLNFNGWRDTVACLDSIAGQTGVECRSVVVDNASQDESVERIGQAHPRAEIILNSSNLGFAGGCNVGIRRAMELGAEYLFIINNDTTLEPDCCALLLECLRGNPDAAVVSPAIYLFSDRSRPWFTGSRVNLELPALQHEERNVRQDGDVAPYDLPWTTGCAMLVPAKRFQQIGVFDERYFCYYEDADWSFRARAAGCRCMLYPRAVIYHKVSASTANTPFLPFYYSARNRLLFFRERMRGPDGRSAVRRLTIQGLRSAARLRLPLPPLRGKDRVVARGSALGTLDYYCGHFGACRFAGS